MHVHQLIPLVVDGHDFILVQLLLPGLNAFWAKPITVRHSLKPQALNVVCPCIGLMCQPSGVITHHHVKLSII
jgi:hypothetical protein